jgi:hypothetical protein
VLWIFWLLILAEIDAFMEELLACLLIKNVWGFPVNLRDTTFVTEY